MELTNMAFKFKCSHCGNDIYVQHLKIGETPMCPHCRQENVVPSSAVELDEINEVGNGVRRGSIPGLHISHFTKENLENVNALEAYPLESSATWATILIWFTVAVLILFLISTILEYLLLIDMKGGITANIQARASAGEAREAVISFFYFLALLGSSIGFFIWFYRAHKNLRYANVPGLKHASGWTVWGFFIPILNFFRPYQMMAETWRGSAAMSGNYDFDKLVAHPSTPKIRWWWALAIIAIPINIASSLIHDSAVSIGDFMIADALRILGGIFYIGYFVLMIYLIKEITGHQSDARKIALVKSTA
jgi:DNA-directed RNA polymerase subunit RPC12/RpoP